jgi:hypothetical protein
MSLVSTGPPGKFRSAPFEFKEARRNKAQGLYKINNPFVIKELFILSAGFVFELSNWFLEDLDKIIGFLDDLATQSQQVIL